MADRLKERFGSFSPTLGSREELEEPLERLASFKGLQLLLFHDDWIAFLWLSLLFSRWRSGSKLSYGTGERGLLGSLQV